MRYLAVLLFLLLFSNPVYAGNVGIASHINSLDASLQQTATDLLAQTNSNWTRIEVPYDPSTNFSQLDGAVNKISAKGIKILLLVSHANGLTDTQLESWVDTLANRYGPKVDAYEIFNEVDNTMSGADYKPFLEKAFNKIEAIDPSATMVVSGLTARSAAKTFWNALYDAGGACCFDALGLHPYRDSSPETKEFNTGSFIDSINLAVSTISAHGGGKKVWLTEFGWKSGSIGEQSQGNFLARSFLLAATLASVQNTIFYRLYDVSGSSDYGITNSDFGKKASFGTVTESFSKLGSATFSEQVSAQSSKVIDNFDSVTGWKNDGSVDGSVSLSATGGRSGGGLKYSWTFSSPTGYVVARKVKQLDGTPSGLSVWINGDNQASVWKLRILDANNETFQFDLGQAPAGWNQYTFNFSSDKAKVSYGGNGVMDFPVRFESIVLDNQNGSTSGSATIDDLEALYGDTDLFALRFGDILAYWKAAGSATASSCGKTLTFTETPQYTTINPGACQPAAAVNTTSSPSPKAKKKSSAAPAPAPAAQVFTPEAVVILQGDETTTPIIVRLKLNLVTGEILGILSGLSILAVWLAWRFGLLAFARRWYDGIKSKN